MAFRNQLHLDVSTPTQYLPPGLYRRQCGNTPRVLPLIAKLASWLCSLSKLLPGTIPNAPAICNAGAPQHILGLHDQASPLLSVDAAFRRRTAAAEATP